MTMKAVAYYRTCPSEPEASDLALRLQREAVQKEVDTRSLHLIAEFTEREGEDGSETYSAYAAAVHAAVAHRGSSSLNEVELIIVMLPRPWSKLKSRVEALFAPGLPLAIHCNVFVTVMKEFAFDKSRHWVMLGRGRAGRIVWDFPGPFLRPGPGKPARSTRGPALATWEAGYGWDGRRPSEPSALMRDCLDRPRARLMEP